MALVLLFFDDDVAGVPAELLIPGRYRLGLVVGIAGRRHVQEVYPPLEIDVVQDRLVANV